MVKSRVGTKTPSVCNASNPKRRGRPRRIEKLPKVTNTLDNHFIGTKVNITSDENDNNREIKVVDASPVRPDAVCLITSPQTPHRIQLSEEVKTKKVAKKNGKEQNHKVTEYFEVRRSVRKTKKIVLEEKKLFLERALRDGTEDGLTVQTFEGKGRGVIASRPFEKGDFVVEYSGELIDIMEAKRREQQYALDKNTGCYMYYFKHKGQQFCVDATAESGRLGRLVNHSRNGNLLTRTVSVDGMPRLVLIAKDYINVGEEITYDYGDRSKESLQYHPWLAY